MADDNSVFGECLVRLLQEIEDVEIIGEAQDGKQAVELIRQMHPDVVIMDVDMPGYGMASKQRDRLPVNFKSVIGLSMGDGDVERRMLSAGAVAYIQKDGLVGRLLTALKNYGNTQT